MIQFMTRFIFVTLLAPAALFAQDETTTAWNGTLNAMGTKLRLEIELTKDGTKQSGKLRSLDQNNAELKLDDVRVNKKTVQFSVPGIGAKFRGKLNKNGNVEGTFQQSGMKLPLTLKPGASAGDDSSPDIEDNGEELIEAWVGKLKMAPINPIMQFRIVETEDGKEKAYFDSVTEGRTGIPVSDWSIENGELVFEVDSIRLTYDGKLNADGTVAEGIWSQGGREFPLTLDRKETEFENKNSWENRPQRPVAPFPYTETEVTFENKTDKITLAGTLTIPKAGSRHAAAILISGSGPQDRDESIMGHKPFMVIADYLSRNGIAVLRYDDRGTAKSTGDHGSATTEDFARDASAAVEFLKNHSAIDASRIGLAGHSEGGLIAPMVVGLRDDVAFVVLMAGTGIDGKRIVVSQSEAMSLAEGESEKDARIAGVVSGKLVDLAIAKNLDDREELKKLVDLAMSTIPESEQEEKESLVRASINAGSTQMQTPWMRFFLTYDPAPALEKITCPVLAIIGSNDKQVLPSINMPAIKSALERGGNDKYEMVELEGLNHLFQKSETGAVSEYASIEETFNPEALKRIGDWISRVTK